MDPIKLAGGLNLPSTRPTHRDGPMPWGYRPLHSDNGSAMKGATMPATLENLGVVASFSRPRVSNDNLYAEALFRTCMYRTDYPRKAFASLDAARP